MEPLPYPDFMRDIRELDCSAVTVEITFQRHGDFTPITSTFVVDGSSVDKIDKIFRGISTACFGHHFNLTIKIRS